MKRKLLITGIFAMLIASAGAVVTENNSTPSNNVGEGEMAITSTSSPSFSSRFEIYNKTPQVSDMEEIITASSFSKSTFEFQGKAVLPTPCHSLEESVEKTGDHAYSFNIEITRPNSSEVCTQQLVLVEYEGSIEAEPPFEVNLKHPGGEEVFKHPDFEEKKKGIIAFLLGLLPF